MSEPRFIVAEVSKGWLGGTHAGELTLVSTRFEEVIQTNWLRGYKLHSWKLSTVITPDKECNETIIAVFERRIGRT